MAVSTGGGGGGSAIRAGRAFVELFADDNKLYRALDAAKARVQSFGAATAKIGAGLFAGGAAGGAAGLYKVIDSLGDTAKIADAGKALGTTAEGASGLFGALGMVGGELKENIEGITQFGAKVRDAFNGVGEEPKKLFDGLSVSAKDLINLPIEEQFYRVVDAINQLDPTLRASKLAVLGGTDSFKQWLPLLSMSSAELRGMADATRLSAAEMDAAVAASRAYKTAVGTLDTVWRKVATAAAPVVQSIADLLTKYLTPLSAWVSANRPAVEAAAKIFFGLAAGAAAVGAALMVVGPAAAVVATVMAGVVTTVGGAIGAIASVGTAVMSAVSLIGALPAAWAAVMAAGGMVAAFLPEIIAAVVGGAAAFALGAAAVGGLAAAFLYLTDTGEAVRGVLAKVFTGDFAGAAGDAAAGLRSAWGSVLGWLDEHFGDTFRNIAETWGAVAEAVGDGDLEGAASLAFDGVRVEWARLTVFLTGQWTGFKDTFVDGWHEAAEQVRLALADIRSAVSGAMAELSKYKDEIGGVASAMSGLGAIKAVGEGLAEYKDEIGAAAAAMSGVGAIKAAVGTGVNAALDNDPNRAGRLAEQEQIQKDARASQAHRDAARAADLDAARRGLDAEERRAAKNRNDSAIDRVMRQLDAELARVEKDDAAKAKQSPPGADDPAKIGKSILSFGGFSDTMQEFGGGGGGFGQQIADAAKKQLAEQQRGNKLLAQMIEAVKGIDVPEPTFIT